MRSTTSFTDAKGKRNAFKMQLDKYNSNKIALRKNALDELRTNLVAAERTIKKVCPHNRCEAKYHQSDYSDEYGSWHSDYYVGVYCHDCDEFVLDSSLYQQYGSLKRAPTPDGLRPIVDLADWWMSVRGSKCQGYEKGRGYELSDVGIKAITETKVQYVRQNVPVTRYLFNE